MFSSNFYSETESPFEKNRVEPQKISFFFKLSLSLVDQCFLVPWCNNISIYWCINRVLVWFGFGVLFCFNKENVVASHSAVTTLAGWPCLRCYQGGYRVFIEIKLMKAWILPRMRPFYWKNAEGWKGANLFKLSVYMSSPRVSRGSWQS